MVRDEEIAFERIPLEDAAQRLHFMAGVSKWDTSDGLMSVSELIGDGAAFEAKRNGVPVLIFGLKKIDWSGGRELLVTIAHQLTSGGMLTEQLLPLIEFRFGHDCDAMRVHTRRRGLIKKLEQQGYSNAATVMRKKL